MMRKTIFLLVLVLAMFSVSVVAARGNPKVVYTWTVNDLGQGVWGGGPLFEDGTAGGNFPLSFYNGQAIAHFHPVSWEEVMPGESIDICFEVRVIKGDFPEEEREPFCFTDVFGEAGLEVTGPGAPLILSPHPDPEIPHPLLIRVTPVN
jgi:hypothetical protein